MHTKGDEELEDRTNHGEGSLPYVRREKKEEKRASI